MCKDNNKKSKDRVGNAQHYSLHWHYFQTTSLATKGCKIWIITPADSRALKYPPHGLAEVVSREFLAPSKAILYTLVPGPSLTLTQGDPICQRCRAAPRILLMLQPGCPQLIYIQSHSMILTLSLSLSNLRRVLSGRFFKAFSRTFLSINRIQRAPFSILQSSAFVKVFGRKVT